MDRDPQGFAHAMKLIRGRLDMTQGEVAERIGLSLRAYQDLEAGATAVRRSHHMAMQYLSLHMAVERGDPKLATYVTADTARRFCKLEATVAAAEG